MSAPAAAPFQYRPLNQNEDQIRLVRVKYQPDELSIIELELEHFDLSTAPPFTALSYT